MNAPRRLLIHDAGGEFDGEWVESFYGALSADDRLTISEEKLGHEAVLDWIMRKD